MKLTRKIIEMYTLTTSIKGLKEIELEINKINFYGEK